MRRLPALLITLMLALATAATVGAQSGPPAGTPHDPQVGLPDTAHQPPTFMRPRDAKPNHGSTSVNLYYHGGVGGIGVETAPKVYLVQWGSQWATDPSGEAAILNGFFSDVGGSSWNKTVTQYCQGIARGSADCSSAPSSALAGN